MEILQGEIGWELTAKGLEGKTSIMINSPGGSLFEGLAMFDFVKANNIEVGVIGLCASAATLPLLASPKRWGTPNSRYLIHNPSFFLPPANYSASDLQTAANDLQSEQNNALELYYNNLSIPKEEIQNLMELDTVIDARQALAIGLILEIRDIQNTQVIENETNVNMLYHKFKMNINTMENKELTKELTGIKGLLSEIKNLFIQKSPKMLILQDVNGIEIDFGTSIETPEQIIVGVSATINGNPANGENVMPTGETYKFENGVLTEIAAMPMNDEALKVELETLKAENESLKAEIQNKETEKKQLQETFETKLVSVQTKLDEIQSKFSTDEPKIVVPPTNKEGNRIGNKRI